MDEYCSMPVRCFYHSCSSEWHLYTYWVEYDEEIKQTVFSRSMDGDQAEYIDEMDVPENSEMDLAWEMYYESVAETGRDPLEQIHVPKRYRGPRREQWHIKFLQAQGVANRVLVVACRRGKKHFTVPALPPHVRDYLKLERVGEAALPWANISVEQFLERGYKFDKEICFRIDNRCKEKVASERALKLAARKILLDEWDRRDGVTYD